MDQLFSLDKWSHPGRQGPRRVLAVVLALAFVWPEVAWAFDRRTLDPHTQIQTPLEVSKRIGRVIAQYGSPSAHPYIFLIQDLHANFEAQSKIKDLVEKLTREQGVSLLALEGSAGDLDTRALGRLPYPRIKARIYDHFLRTGQLSGAEVPALVRETDLRLFGAEDPEEYAESVTLARSFLGRDVQTRFQSLRFMYEELSDALLSEDLLRLDEKHFEFLDGRLSGPDYAEVLRREAAARGLDLRASPELTALADPRSDLDPVQRERVLWPVLQDLRTRSYTDPRQGELDARRRDLDVLERVLNVAAYPEDLEDVLHRPDDFRVERFLSFYREQAAACRLTAAPDRTLTELEERTQAALRFYTLAQKRNSSLVDNTLRRLRELGQDRAVLVAGGFHTAGLSAVLRARGVAHTTLSPTLTDRSDPSAYYARLTGEPGPFQRLTRPSARFLALPSALLRGPEQQEFWQEFTALYLGAVAPWLARGRTLDEFRAALVPILTELNRDSPYPVSLDEARLAQVWGEPLVLLPLVVQDGDRSVLVTLTTRPLPAHKPFYSRSGPRSVHVYELTATPDLAAAQRRRPSVVLERSASAGWAVLTDGVHHLRAAMRPKAVSAEGTRSPGPAKLRLPMTQRLKLLAPALGRVLLANPRVAFGLLFAILGIGVTVATGTVGMSAAVMPLSLGGEALQDRLDEIETRRAVPVLEHPLNTEGDYIAEASRNLQALLSALDVPQGAVVVNVGSGRNPLTVPGYRVVNIDTVDMGPARAPGEFAQADFFAPGFLEQVRSQTGIASAPDVVLFFNMATFMDLYGPYGGPDLGLRRILNADAYLHRALEVVRPGGQVLSFEFMPPWAPGGTDTRAALNLFDRVLQSAAGVVSRVLLRRDRDGLPVAVAHRTRGPDQATPEHVGGAIRVSLGRAVLASLSAVLLGTVFSFTLGPAALLGVALWGSCAGFALAFNYAPRIYYAWRLLRGKGEVLTGETVEAELGPTLENVLNDLRRRGGIGDDFTRPDLAVLPRQSPGALLLGGIQVAHGVGGSTGNVIHVHPNFLRLPPLLRRIILEHEVLEAAGAGHWRATLAEYRAYMRVRLDPASGALQSLSLFAGAGILVVVALIMGAPAMVAGMSALLASLVVSILLFTVAYPGLYPALLAMLITRALAPVQQRLERLVILHGRSQDLTFNLTAAQRLIGWFQTRNTALPEYQVARIVLRQYLRRSAERQALHLPIFEQVYAEMRHQLGSLYDPTRGEQAILCLQEQDLPRWTVRRPDRAERLRSILLRQAGAYFRRVGGFDGGRALGQERREDSFNASMAAAAVLEGVGDVAALDALIVEAGRRRQEHRTATALPELITRQRVAVNRDQDFESAENIQMEITEQREAIRRWTNLELMLQQVIARLGSRADAPPEARARANAYLLEVVQDHTASGEGFYWLREQAAYRLRDFDTPETRRVLAGLGSLPLDPRTCIMEDVAAADPNTVSLELAAAESLAYMERTRARTRALARDLQGLERAEHRVQHLQGIVDALTSPEIDRDTVVVILRWLTHQSRDLTYAANLLLPVLEALSLRQGDPLFTAPSQRTLLNDKQVQLAAERALLQVARSVGTVHLKSLPAAHPLRKQYEQALQNLETNLRENRYSERSVKTVQASVHFLLGNTHRLAELTGFDDPRLRPLTPKVVAMSGVSTAESLLEAAGTLLDEPLALIYSPGYNGSHDGRARGRSLTVLRIDLPSLGAAARLMTVAAFRDGGPVSLLLDRMLAEELNADAGSCAEAWETLRARYAQEAEAAGVRSGFNAFAGQVRPLLEQVDALGLPAQQQPLRSLLLEAWLITAGGVGQDLMNPDGIEAGCEAFARMLGTRTLALPASPFGAQWMVRTAAGQELIGENCISYMPRAPITGQVRPSARIVTLEHYHPPTPFASRAAHLVRNATVVISGLAMRWATSFACFLLDPVLMRALSQNGRATRVLLANPVRDSEFYGQSFGDILAFIARVTRRSVSGLWSAILASTPADLDAPFKPYQPQRGTVEDVLWQAHLGNFGTTQIPEFQEWSLASEGVEVLDREGLVEVVREPSRRDPSRSLPVVRYVPELLAAALWKLVPHAERPSLRLSPIIAFLQQARELEVRLAAEGLSWSALGLTSPLELRFFPELARHLQAWFEGRSALPGELVPRREGESQFQSQVRAGLEACQAEFSQQMPRFTPLPLSGKDLALDAPIPIAQFRLDDESYEVQVRLRTEEPRAGRMDLPPPAEPATRLGRMVLNGGVVQIEVPAEVLRLGETPAERARYLKTAVSYHVYGLAASKSKARLTPKRSPQGEADRVSFLHDAALRRLAMLNQRDGAASPHERFEQLMLFLPAVRRIREAVRDGKTVVFITDRDGTVTLHQKPMSPVELRRYAAPLPLTMVKAILTGSRFPAVFTQLVVPLLRRQYQLEMLSEITGLPAQTPGLQPDTLSNLLFGILSGMNVFGRKGKRRLEQIQQRVMDPTQADLVELALYATLPIDLDEAEGRKGRQVERRFPSIRLGKRGYSVLGYTTIACIATGTEATPEANRAYDPSGVRRTLQGAVVSLLLADPRAFYERVREWVAEDPPEWRIRVQGEDAKPIEVVVPEAQKPQIRRVFQDLAARAAQDPKVEEFLTRNDPITLSIQPWGDANTDFTVGSKNEGVTTLLDTLGLDPGQTFVVYAGDEARLKWVQHGGQRVLSEGNDYAVVLNPAVDLVLFNGALGPDIVLGPKTIASPGGVAPEHLNSLFSFTALDQMQGPAVAAVRHDLAQLTRMLAQRGLTWAHFGVKDPGELNEAQARDVLSLLQVPFARPGQQEEGPYPAPSQRKGSLYVSPLRAAALALGAVGVGLVFGFTLGPAALTTVSVWGAVSGLGLVLNYVPRLYYLYRLSRPHAPPLASDEGRAELEERFLELEQAGGLPEGYRRPEVRELPRQGFWSQLLRGVLLGRGEGVGEDTVVNLHRNFLAEPRGAQLAILRHEIFEAHGRGHARATLAELTTLLGPRVIVPALFALLAAGFLILQPLAFGNLTVGTLSLAAMTWRAVVALRTPRIAYNVTTYPERMDRIHELLLTLPELRRLIRRGAIVMDVGPGWPMSTTERLAQAVHEVDPSVRVIAAELPGRVAETLVQDAVSGWYAFFRKNGELIDVFSEQGRVLRKGSVRRRFQKEYARIAAGRPAAGITLIERPHARFAQAAGFDLIEADLGRGVPADLKLAFNFLYMYRGRESLVLSLLGKDLAEGGCLLAGFNLPNGNGDVACALLQKRDGVLVPVQALASVGGRWHAADISELSLAEVGRVLNDLYKSSGRPFSFEENDILPFFRGAFPPGRIPSFRALAPTTVRLPVPSQGPTTESLGLLRPARPDLGLAHLDRRPTSIGTDDLRGSPLRGPDRVPIEALARGDLSVSPLRAAALALGAVGVGLVFGFTLGPAALTTVSVWGAVSGLGLVLNYVPRLYYLYRLSRPHAPPLAPGTAEAQVADLFDTLEAQGGLPEGYRRPAIEVLAGRSPVSRWWQGVLVGKGEARTEGPVVALHEHFPSLPPAVQLAVLRHEVYEAHEKGHARATLAEYGSYLKLGARPAARVTAPAAADRPSRLRQVLVTAGYAALGLLGVAASVSSIVIFVTGALPWSLGVFLSAAAAWLFVVALGPLLEPAPGPARTGSQAGLSRRRLLKFLGLSALMVWAAVKVPSWWSGPAFTAMAPTSGEVRDLAELDRRRREAFRAWERRPVPDLLQTYLALCRQEDLALSGLARTPGLVRDLGLTGKAAEIFLRYGVISEGDDRRQFTWTEAVLLAYPETFTAKTRFVTWSPAVAANAWRWEAPALLLPRDGEADFKNQAARLLGPIWDAEPANSTVRASFLARYGQAAKRSFQRIYGERLDALLDLPWTAARLIPASSFAGGHWVLRVRDAWISVVGEFTRAQLKAVQTAYHGVPANHLDGFRLVQELRSAKPGLAGQQFGDVIDLRDTGSRSRVQPFVRLAYAIGSVTNQVETHELAHYVHSRLSPFLREAWAALHEAGRAREHCVSQYAFDAKGESWVGNPVMEDFAETYTVFKEELARGNVALDGLSAPLREKLRFMAGLFVVAGPARSPRVRPGTLHVNGRDHPVTLDEDGSLSEPSFRVWAQERLQERLEAGIELQEEPNWDLMESLAATSPALDPGRPVLHAQDLARVLDQREAYPRTYGWLTGLDPSDADVAERLHLGLARLAADLRVDPRAVWVPAGLLLGLAEPPDAGTPWQRITAASARWFVRAVRANGPDENGVTKWDLDIGYAADPSVREIFSDRDLYALEDWAAANAVPRPGTLRRVEPFEDPVALAQAEERIVERMRSREAGAGDELERIMVSYYTIRREDLRSFSALDEAGHRRLIALLRRAPGLSVEYLVRTFRSFSEKGWLNVPLLFRGYYGEDAYRDLLQDPDQAAIFVSLVVECGNQETWSLKRMLDLAAQAPDPVRGLSAILAGLAIAKRLGLAPTLADMIVSGEFPGVTAQNRVDLLAAFLNQVPEDQGLAWLNGYLDQGLFTPAELEEVRTLGSECGFAVQSRIINYLGTLRSENDAVISVAPVRPFDWRGSLRTAAFFLATGLGSVTLALALGPAAPLLLGGLVLQPGLALLAGASAFGVAGFLALALDVRGSRFWEFLARRGMVRAGPDRLLAEFRAARPAEPGAPAPVYTRGSTLYADREFLAQRPRWLQRVYLGHERWHAAFPGRGEVFAFGPQAAPLVLAQVLGLSLALGAAPGVAAIFGAAALAAAGANVLRSARPAAQEHLRALAAALGRLWTRTWTYVRTHPVQSAFLALALISPLAGQSVPVLAAVLGRAASEPEDRGRETLSGEPAFSGETVILRPARERALPVHEALGGLGSLWTSRAVSAAASLEARWEEVPARDRGEALSRLIGLISHENRRVRYSAWLALRGIARLLPPGAERDRIERELDWKKSIGRVQVGTGPGRLTRVHDLILTYPPLRALLERPEGCVVQDVGLGGPEPVTTAELATRLRPFGPRVRVVGSDLMVPALRMDGSEGQFAYFDEAGRFIGAYDGVGAPLTGPKEEENWQARLAAVREGKAGAKPLLTERPLDAYARRYGFELVSGAFGAGVKSDLMIFANALYLYAGREEEALAELTKGLNEGGFLITADAAVGADATSLVLYQKRQGRLEPVLFRNIEYNLQHTIELAGRGWTVTQAESLLMDVSEQRFSDNFELLYNPAELKRAYGLEKKDVVFERIRGLDAVAAEPVLGPDEAGPDAGERSGNLFVSLRDSLARQLVVFFLGLDLSLAIAPNASIQWLAPVWGVVAGLGLFLTFAPRAYYWWRLRRGTEEALTPENVGAQERLVQLLNILEVNGRWPPGLARETLEFQVLKEPVALSWRTLWTGTLLARVQGGVDGRVRIGLHPRFLALPMELQLVVLLHELVHAMGAGHGWATLAELAFLWKVLRHGFHPAGVVGRQELEEFRSALTGLSLARTLSPAQWAAYPEPRPEIGSPWSVVEVNHWSDLPKALARARRSGTRALDLVAVSLAEIEPLTGTVKLTVVVDQLYRLEQDTRPGRDLPLNDRPGLLTAMLQRAPDSPWVLACGVSGPLCQPLAAALAERLRERLPEVEVRGWVTQAYQWQVLAEQFRFEVPWQEVGTEYGWRWVLNALGIVPAGAALQEPFAALVARVKDEAEARGQTDAEYLLAAMQDKAALLTRDRAAFAAWQRTFFSSYRSLPVDTQIGPESDPAAGLQVVFGALFGTNVLAGKVRPQAAAPLSGERADPLAVPDRGASTQSVQARPGSLLRRDGGELSVSPLKAAALALGAVGIGLVFGFTLGPAALTTVSIWGAVSGLGLVLNYVPRLYYLVLLSRPHAPPLMAATADAQLEDLFRTLEAQGGLPAGYRRPAIEVLAGRSSVSRWWQGVLVGKGEARDEGPVVALHENFLSLPVAVQLAVLRHEVYEAHEKGHARATLAEYASYLKLVARRAAAEGTHFAALPEAVAPEWVLLFEGSARSGDRRLLSEVAEQDRILDECLRRTMGSRVAELAQADTQVRVRYLARGLFKRVYVAEIRVRFEDGTAKTVPVVLKVPRWGFLGPFLTSQMDRSRSALAGRTVLPEFGITSRGVIAEAFVAGSAPRVDPEGEVAGRADPAVRRRLVALYIETLAGLRASRGARAFFFDPKPENVLMSAGPARTLTLIDQDLALTAPVAFGPFTDLVMLSAYYGTRPVAARLQNVFRGLLTPFLPFISLVFAFLVRPDRQVFDGVLDALGPEAGRAYLERARRSRAGRLAAPSGFMRALSAYLDAPMRFDAPSEGTPGLPRPTLAELGSDSGLPGGGQYSGPALVLRNGWPELVSTDPALVRGWQAMQTAEWAQVRKALAAHLRTGGELRLGTQGQGRLLRTDRNIWWLDPLLLAGRPEGPQRPELSPAPPAVWVLLLPSGPGSAATAGLNAGFEALSRLLDASDRAGLEAGADWLARYAGEGLPGVLRTAVADRTDRARAALWAEDLRWVAAKLTEGATAFSAPTVARDVLETLARRVREISPAAWLGDAVGQETVWGETIASWPMVRVDDSSDLPGALARLADGGMAADRPVLAMVVETLPGFGEVRLMLFGDTLGRLREVASAIPAVRGQGLLNKVGLVESLELRPGRAGEASEVHLDAMGLPAPLRDRRLSTVWFADLRTRLTELMPGATLSATVIHPGAALSCVRSFGMDLSWTQSGRAEMRLGWENILRLLEIMPSGPELDGSPGAVAEAITTAMVGAGWSGSNYAEFLVRRVQDLAMSLQGHPEAYQRSAADFDFRGARIPTELPAVLSGPETPLADLTAFLFERVIGGLYLTGRLPGTAAGARPAGEPRTPPAAPGSRAADRTPDTEAGPALTEAETRLRAWVGPQIEADLRGAGVRVADPDLTNAWAERAAADPTLTAALDRARAPAQSAALRLEWLKTAIEEALDERVLAAVPTSALDPDRLAGPMSGMLELRRRAAPALPALAGGGERRTDEARVAVRRAPQQRFGDGLLLATAALVLAGRRVLVLRRALARTRALPGPPLWLILRHARFWVVTQGLLARVRGERREDGTADPAAVDAVRDSLRRNPAFRILFGRSARLDPLGAELLGLDREADGLGLIGWELAPELYVREALDAKLRQDGISVPVRESLLNRLWAQPAWSKHLSRLQSAALAGTRDGAEVNRLRMLRHQRRLLMLLLAELDRPEGSREDQEAVLRALAVFASDRPVRVRIARSDEQGIAYGQYQVPDLVLTHPLLRSRLLALFAVYDDSGRQLQPADPVTRTVAGSA